jgi:Effector-associated domain 11
MKDKKLLELISKGEFTTAIKYLEIKAGQDQDLLSDLSQLHSQYNRLQKEIMLNTISRPDAELKINQLNAALVGFSSLTTPLQHPKSQSSSKWLWLLLVIPLAYGINILLKPAPEPETPSLIQVPAKLTNKSSKNIQLPALCMLIFGQGKPTVTYTFNTAKIASYSNDKNLITIGLRCINHDRYPINFWNNSFRFKAENYPKFAPTGDLNKLVDADSFQDGEITFLLPKNVTTGEVIVATSDENKSITISF